MDVQAEMATMPTSAIGVIELNQPGVVYVQA